MHSTTLLDLPDELLSRCLPDEASVDIRPCIAVCRRLLGVLLKSSRSGALGLRLQISHPDDVPIRRATLQQMTKAFPDLHRLLIQSPRGGLGAQLAAVLAAPADSAAGWLKGITHMCLEKLEDNEQNAPLYLSHPVHISVAAACPNLKELKLTGIAFSEQHQHITDAPYQEKLKELVQVFGDQGPANRAPTEQQSHDVGNGGRTDVVRIAGDHIAEQRGAMKQHGLQSEGLLACLPSWALAAIAAPARLKHLKQLMLHQCSFCTSAAAFQEQLQMLPSLQGISMVRPAYRFGAQEEYSAAVADSCCDRLRSLDWHITGKEAPTALMSKPYVHLQQLLMPSARGGDSCFDLLLQHAPSLKKLHVYGIELKQDFSHRQCSWEELVLTSWFDILSLTRMPLGHAPKLVAGSAWLCVCLVRTEGRTADEQLRLTAAAAAVVEHCRGLSLLDGIAPGSMKVSINSLDRTLASQLVVAMLPILRNVPGQLTLRNAEVTSSLLQAISSQLPGCVHVILGGDCTFQEGIWGSMVTLLPHVTRIDMLCERVALHQLMVLCAMATHPLTLMLRDEFNGQVAVLLQAARDAGHNFVSF